MRDPFLSRQADHPSLELLLRHLEGELDPKQSDFVGKHLTQCWACMTEGESVKEGIRSFMEYREKVLIPTIPLDARTANVRRRVVEASMNTRRSLWPALRFSLRPAWIAGTVSALLFCCLFLFLVGTPPQMPAAEFLMRVRTSLAKQKSLERGKVVCQRVQLSRGSSVVERRIVHGPEVPRVERSLTKQIQKPAWAASLAGPMEWDDPLDLDSFLRWRNVQHLSREDVASTPGVLTLTTVVSDSNVIRRVSLTVRLADWHVIAKQVEMQDEPAIIATETRYEVRAPTGLGNVSKERLEPPSPRSIQAPAPVLAEPERDLDDAEVSVRSALFRLGFGLGREEVAPSVQRTKNAIVVQGVVSTAERRNQLALELAGIPNTVNKVSGTFAPVPAAGSRSHRAEIFASAETQAVDPPQLRQMLIQHFGDESNATAFANQVLANSGEIFALTVQYHELAKRYPPSEAGGLAPQARDRLSLLTQQIEQAITSRLLDGDKILNPLLGNGTQPDTPVASASLNWQTKAERAFQLASASERAAARLFAVTARDMSSHASATDTIRQFQTFRSGMANLLSDSATEQPEAKNPGVRQ